MKGIKQLAPTKKEREKELAIANKLIDSIKKVSGKKALLVGSIAKDTCLKGNKDFDVFILFPKTTSRKTLEKEGLGIAKKVCGQLKIKPVVHYAEHPYTKTVYKGYDVDLVPCYELKKGDKIISAVDRSPLHLTYVKENLAKTNDVRLLKHFMKKIGVYGAEISTHGFSGYLAELLVLYYGGFQEVLENASKWKVGQTIDLENYKTAKKFNDPLIVIDPVDANRNVAAPVSEEKLCQFILLSREYLKTKKIPSKTSIGRERGKFFVVEWPLKEENDEIIFGQLQRYEKKLVKALNLKEFSVIDSLIWADSKTKAQIIIELEVWDLPRVNDHLGPRVYDKEHANKFVEKYKKIRVRGNRLLTEKKRDFVKAMDFIKWHVKNEAPTHLKKKGKFFEGSKTKNTQAYKEYAKKFWKMS